MGLKKITLFVKPEHQNERLDQFLSKELPKELFTGPASEPGPSLSKSKIRKLIVAGAVYLNGRRIRIASKNLFNGASVDIFLDLQKMIPKTFDAMKSFQLNSSHLLYEDEWIVAMNKPAGLPTQPTLDEARQNLFTETKRYLRDRKPGGSPYLALHHRLDRDTSGVILFVKKQEANRGVSELFKKHEIQKMYWALTQQPLEKKVPSEWTIKNYLGRVRVGGKKNKYHSVRSGGDFAHTEFKVLERKGGGLLIQAMPLTGRTHQIRVHLSEFGIPILGDVTYGGDLSCAERVMLHAAELRFLHPLTCQPVEIQCPLPEDFKKCLDKFK